MIMAIGSGAGLGAGTGFVTRFAPSPTGRLHLGHAFSALTAFHAAEAAGGRLLLRIEDIDQGRCRPSFEAAIFEDLAWLGLRWEEPVRRQSEHLAAYAAALAALADRGLVYRCFRTRREIAEASAAAPHGPEAPFSGAPLTADEEAERLARGEAFAWRLSMARCRDALGAGFDALAFEDETGRRLAQPARAGDIVLARKETPTSYHLAATHDDALQGVTDVIRGEDLRAAIDVQRLLQALMGWPTPRYRHHRLVCGPDGRRLAKRDQARTLAELRAGGATAAELRAELGFR